MDYDLIFDYHDPFFVASFTAKNVDFKTTTFIRNESVFSDFTIQI